ncbi:MAG: threonine aldolase [Paracoccaceae bacterium]|jgi:threonine aldolase
MNNALGSNRCLCDLRSDTMTVPDAAMLAAMAVAEVGDDVYGEDPTVAKLESRLAELLGKDAAVFFPSGTQSNLAAVMAHCGRGDELIIGDRYHIYCDEAAGPSVLAGVSMNAIPTMGTGAVSPQSVQAAIKDDDQHYARSRLLCLENTVGGQAISLEDMFAAAKVAQDAGMAVHLDGARFFNAIAALDCSPVALANCADSISVCMSKGLGAPVGSVLVGSHGIIAQARRNRKILGGAMRQVGILAAAAIHALDHNVAGLARDHVNAARVAKTLSDLNAGEVRVNTNTIFFTPRDGKQDQLRVHMGQSGVRIGGQSPAIRMVFHRDVTDEGLETAIEAFEAYFKET